LSFTLATDTSKVHPLSVAGGSDLKLIIASIVGAAAVFCTATAQPTAQSDWTSPSGVLTLSFRSVGWDLVSKLRPGKEMGAPFSLDIMAKDSQVFCNVAELVGPLSTAASPEHVVAQLMEINKVGSVIANNLGGSRVVQSEVEQAGSVLAHRLVIETLDQQRPILSSTTIRFLAPKGSSLVAGQIDCAVGGGSQSRAGDIEAILKTVRINGVALEPVK
jgi:hypothetical protein